MLRKERHDGVLTLVLAREGAGNSMSTALAAALEEAVAEAAADPALRALVLTGEGERFFCSGGDVKEYSGIADPVRLQEVFGRMRGILDAVEALPVPTVAAVNGIALGGGAELILACDLRLAAAHARFCYPQVRLGVIPGWNGIARLVRVCGEGTTMRLLMAAETIDAAEALRLGLVHRVVMGPVVAAAQTLAAELATLPPRALAATKELVRGTGRLTPEEFRRRYAAAFEQLWFSEEHRAAERAFVEKRKKSAEP